MQWQYTPYVLPFVFTAITSAALIVVTWRHRSAPGATPLILVMAAVFEWSAGNALELLSVELGAKIWWANVEYLGIVAVPLAWFVFAARYTGRDKWLTRRILILLTLVPATTIVMVWTNELHGLIRYNIWLDSSGPFPVVSKTYGPWFWVQVGYSYVLLFISTVWLVQTLTRSPRLYRMQRTVLLIGAVMPWVGNVLYISHLSPIPKLDLTPPSFALSSLAMVWGLYRFHLLDIVPIARDLVMESMSDGVIVLDAQNRIVDLNPAIQRVIGCTASEAIGQRADYVLSSWPDLVERYRDVIETNAEITLSQNQTPRYMDLRISPLHDRDGQVKGRLVVLRDITERKQAEEALRDAKDAAESANRAKSVFLTTMSHELRTPLTAILGFSELLQVKTMELGHSDYTPHIEKIQTAGRRLLSLINGILELSRIEMGKTEMYIDVFKINDLIGEVSYLGQQMARKNDNTFQVHCSPDLGVMHADPNAVQRVLVNLISNAAKFTEHGDITLSVSREASPGGNGDWVHFRVADTGIGMTPDQMQHLFEAFWQADGSITRKYDGSGLGLAVSHRLCRAMGGEIIVNSQPGRGSVFTVRLPAQIVWPGAG